MSAGSRRRRAMSARLAILAGAAVVTAISVLPFLWIVIASITPENNPSDVDTWSSVRGVRYFPSRPSLQNYAAVFETVPFLKYFSNSLVIATGTTAISTIVASLGSYGFVRFRFRGRAPLLFAMLMAYMIPSVVLLVPLMVIFRSYGLMNTHLGVMLAESTIAAPFVLLLMINYLSALPRELEEAALVDGCSRLGALVRIVLPLAAPGLVAGGLFAFINSWNHFLYAYLLTSSDATRTLPVIMRLFALGEPAVWGTSAAGAVMTTIPVALLFLMFQRRLISGLAAGAVKA